MIKDIIDDFLVIMPLCGFSETLTMSNDLKRYINDCKILFPIYGTREKRFMEKIICNINHQEVTYDEIVEQFGSPSEIIISYFNEQDDMYLIQRTKTYKTIHTYLIILAAFLTLLASCSQN
ncbi:MAG: DUF6120 family protein [Erysipelotrichaceae bacterium]|nr:DUF6120 family protein [Erysipelotrichaceae bacterium]